LNSTWDNAGLIIEQLINIFTAAQQDQNSDVLFNRTDVEVGERSAVGMKVCAALFFKSNGIAEID